MATKKQSDNELPPVFPLEPCPSWEAAEDVAREALVYILQDGHEAGANRIKAAALVLEARRLTRAPEGQTEGHFEDWLREQPKSHL